MSCLRWSCLGSWLALSEAGGVLVLVLVPVPVLVLVPVLVQLLVRRVGGSFTASMLPGSVLFQIPTITLI